MKKQPASNRVPTFEECLTFVMGELSHSRTNEKKATLTPTEKHRFNQMERKAALLDLDEYRDILRRVLVPGLHDLKSDSNELVRLLEEELRTFLKRYEILNWQIIPSRATRQQVLWSLSYRFLIPWVALRVAYRLPNDSADSDDREDWWFQPVKADSLHPCVMKVLDQFVRKPGESKAALSKRIYRLDSLRGRSSAEISERAEKEEDARKLEDNISKYSHFKTSPPNRTIERIVASNPGVEHLRLMLVLARFVDRCVRAALKVFDKDRIVALLDYYALCFTHLRAVVRQVRTENPKLNPEQVWTFLQSRTYMGNSPGQDERFLPLMDRFMNELARKINAEVQQSLPNHELARLPRGLDELHYGQWQFWDQVTIPKEIELAPYRGTVSAAVETSRREFRGRVRIAQATRACGRFRFTGLAAHTALAEGWPLRCTVEDANLALDEAKRLFHIIVQQVTPSRKPLVALDFLVFIIEPYRPKSVEDSGIARGLLRKVTKHLMERNLQGAFSYLEGSLLSLEGSERAAVRAFSTARKLGRESCGQFWIELLRRASMTAEKLEAKREHNHFTKLLRVFGVFSNDSTPRSNELNAQMKEGDFRRVWSAGFKPFPRRA